MKPVAKCIDAAAGLFEVLQEFDENTLLYTADQIREAQVKVLREAALGCDYGRDRDYLRRMADKLEGEGK